ncbi:MAG: GAF domain-containing protein [Chloroflexi bacterium]|nr:GAF domain-containing protein [Chloroflexota bacterium]
MYLRDDPAREYEEFIYRNERLFGTLLRWVLLAVGLIGTRFLQTFRYHSFLALGCLVYLIATVILTYVFVVEKELVQRASRNFYLGIYVLDIAFVSLVIYFSGGVSSEAFLMYGLLAIKGALYYPAWHSAVLISLFLAPLYVLVLYLAAGSVYFLTDTDFWLRYALLFAGVLGGIYLGWVLEERQSYINTLDRELDLKSIDLDRKARVLQKTASDLGDRVLELRTLQEGIKAINSALALESVLRLIVANASQVLGGARCTIALFDEEAGGVVTRAASGVALEDLQATRFKLDQGIEGWVIQSGRPALVSDVETDSRFVNLSGVPVASLICVPLFSDGRAIGALTAMSPERDAFNTESLNLLDAFADQAAVAVKNARLYERLTQEQRQTAALYQRVYEKSNELEAILRGIGDGVIVTDPKLRLLLVNPVATRIFGIGSDVDTSVPISQLVLDHAALSQLFEDALANPDKAVAREITLSKGDKEMIFAALASTVRGADGNVRGVVTVLRDVTSQKELDRMKSDFLSVVSHELKTPLHSIKGFVDIILMGKTGEINEVQRDFLQTVMDQATQLQNLINDLLEFSRLESGQVKLRPEPMSLYEVADRVVGRLKPLADQGGVNLKSDIAADFTVIEADAARVEQVITNLVDNAIKFTPSGGRVVISAEDRGNHVQVSVSDTGIGIPPEEQERIFDRFYQVEKGPTRSYRGTGLGLTICKHIVEHHHGRIWVESREGEGSVFHFTLPKRMPDQEELLLDFSTLPERETP